MRGREKRKKPISQGPSGSGVQQWRHGDGDELVVASQAETHRQVCGKAIILSLSDLNFPTGHLNTNMAKDRVAPNGALGGQAPGTIASVSLTL